MATPGQTEGPFFVDAKLNRSNLLEGETDPNTLEGVPLHLLLAVYEVTDHVCLPLRGAVVDIWHADNQGIYSGIPTHPFQATDTAGKTFGRGYQTTNSRGLVSFSTNYPGWYDSRTIHIHFKIRKYVRQSDKTFELTSQLYFDDAISDVVLESGPYKSGVNRPVRNHTDQIYNGTGVGSGPDLMGPAPGSTVPGSLTTVDLIRRGESYIGSFAIGLRMA